MTTERTTRGLGKGLSALLGEAPTAAPPAGESVNRSGVREIEIGRIRPNPNQPRSHFDEDALAELADSIAERGLLQPILLRGDGDGYQIVAGERRWRAAREAGLRTVPAVVREADDRDSLLLALVENVAREQLSPVDEARAYAVLLDEFGLSLGELAGRVGRSKPAVSNRLRLLELPDDVLALVEGGELSEGHARAVLAVPDHDGRRALARRIVRRGLSVRAAERAAREAGAATRRVRSRTGLDPVLAERARRAAERVTGRPARVLAGRVELPFADEHELAELIEALERAAA
jgi:ParB family chromosome partitioning protein